MSCETEQDQEPSSVPAWVTAACSTDDGRPALSHAWQIEWNGEPWTIATNGVLAILARGAFGAADGMAPDSGAPSFLGILGAPRSPQRSPLDLDAFRAWLGIDVTRPTCERCAGAGEWECPECKGEGETECECMDCGNEHTGECRVCAGFGVKKCPDCHPSSRDSDSGYVFGRLFDRRQLRRGFAALPGQSAVWIDDADKREGLARIEGDGWVALVMPLRNVGMRANDDVHPRFPAVAMEAVA